MRRWRCKCSGIGKLVASIADRGQGKGTGVMAEEVFLLSLVSISELLESSSLALELRLALLLLGFAE